MATDEIYIENNTTNITAILVQPKPTTASFEGDLFVSNGAGDAPVTNALYYAPPSGAASVLIGGAGAVPVTTAANVGTAGVGVFKNKTGSTLNFKNINAGSAKITVFDDVGDDEIDIDLGAVSINDLSDVDTTSVSNGNALVFNGTDWVDQSNTVTTTGVAYGEGNTAGATGTVIGTSSTASASESIAVGQNSSATGARSIAVGLAGSALLDDTYNIMGGSIIRKDDGELATNAHRHWTGCQMSYATEEIDLTVVGPTNYTITIPTGATFFPDSIDIIQTVTGSSDATIDLGESGDNNKYFPSVSQGNDAAGVRNVYTGLSSSEGTTGPQARVAGVASAGNARVIWKGILVEDE